MTEQKPEIKMVKVTESVKKRWELVSEEEYPKLMAEYARLTLDEIKKSNREIIEVKARVRAIQSGVNLIALFFVLSAIFGGCYAFGL